MNRRKILGFLGAAPVAAALPAVAETPVPATTPILGELRYFSEQTPAYYYNGYGPSPVDPFFYNNNIHTHSYTAAASGGFISVVSKIYDGEKWVYENSQAGVDVKNKVLRS